MNWLGKLLQGVEYVRQYQLRRAINPSHEYISASGTGVQCMRGVSSRLCAHIRRCGHGAGMPGELSHKPRGASLQATDESMSLHESRKECEEGREEKGQSGTKETS